MLTIEAYRAGTKFSALLGSRAPGFISVCYSRVLLANDGRHGLLLLNPKPCDFESHRLTRFQAFRWFLAQAHSAR